MIKKSTSNKIAISTTLVGMGAGVGIGYLAFNNGMPIQIVEETKETKENKEHLAGTTKNLKGLEGSGGAIYSHFIEYNESTLITPNIKGGKLLTSVGEPIQSVPHLVFIGSSIIKPQLKIQAQEPKQSKAQQKTPSQPVGYRFNTKEEIDKDFDNRHPGWLETFWPRNECISHYNKGLYKEDHKQYALDKCQPVATTKPK